MQEKKSNHFFYQFFFIISVVLVTTFFIFTGLSIFHTPLPSKNKPLIIYSNQLGNNLKKIFLKAIFLSEKSLYIHSFALTDEDLLALLFNKHLKNQELMVVTDSKTTPRQFPFLKSSFNWKAIKSSGLMHEKVLLVDDQISFLGTANMTYESMKMHDNVVIGFHSPELNLFLKKYTKEVESKKKNKNQSNADFLIGGQKISLWMLPFKGNKPIENLLDIIASAQSSISISMFTLTHPDVLNALVKKHKEGLKVRIYLDHSSSKGASLKAYEFLKKNNLQIFISQGIQLLHHKMMLVDNKTFVLGSANWTLAAFKKNHDFYLVIENLSALQKKQLNKLFILIEKESKKEAF